MTPQELHEHIQRQGEINEKLFAHVKVSNEEMGVLKNDVSWLRTLYDKLENRMEKLDAKIWAVLVVVIIGLLAQIVFKFL